MVQVTNPVQVTLAGGSALTGVIEISATLLASLARVQKDGDTVTVWAWGDNRAGQLGDGTTTARLNPVQVATAGGDAFAATSLGHGPTGYQSLATSPGTTNGKSWGSNDSGQLGDGTTSSRSNPVDIIQ
jgi:alpha-tubulin suppressor-like RCC1 family protein